MLVSYNWLKEYVDIDVDAYELAEIITRAGVEIGGVRSTGEGISGVVIAEVMACEKHPDSDHMHLCQVSIDGDHLIQVVCGAPNVAKGQKVCFAQVGATLPNDVKIGQATLRGIVSNGMICSMQELGIVEELTAPDDKNGIRVLPNDAPIGVDALEYLGLNDYVLEFDLTPNRSDCLSVYNIAREIGALLNKPVREIDTTCTYGGSETCKDISVRIDNPEYCHRYVGVLIRDCQDKRSPMWMEHRLQCAGMRPKSMLIDVTNYVMLELGQPLHAFDYKDIAEGQIIVRCATEDETIVTLDGETRKLNAETLLITDAKRAVGVAGVMGGENTEIKEDSQTIFIESAWFNPQNIRRTSLRLGLRTEASIRNEKSVDMNGVAFAAERASSLIAQYTGGVVAPNMLDVFPTPHQLDNIVLRFDYCNSVLGTDIPSNDMVDILTRLHFTILEETPATLTVKAPSYRPDVTIEEDLIEEIARVYGYDNIPETLPYGATHPGVLTPKQRLRKAIRERLTGLGLHDVVTYTFIKRQFADELMLEQNDPLRQVIEVSNPISEDMAVMRTTLVPSLLDVVVTNQRHDHYDVAAYEIGNVFISDHELSKDQLAEEPERLGIVLSGKEETDWLQNGVQYDYYYLKGLIEDLVRVLNVGELSLEPVSDLSIWHPGRSAKLYLNDKYFGMIGEIHPAVIKNKGIRSSVYMAELELSLIYEQGITPIIGKTPTRYPAVTRDLALVVDENIPQATVAKAIESVESALLKQVRLFDVYTGQSLENGKKSLAFALRFQSDKQTLTDEVVDKEVAHILAACELKCQATLRH